MKTEKQDTTRIATFAFMVCAFRLPFYFILFTLYFTFYFFAFPWFATASMAFFTSSGSPR